MLQLCRTCHGEITTDDYTAINANNDHSASIKSELLSCVPELQQDLVKDPVLCSACENALHLAYTFKSQCLDTEQYIRNYFLNTKLSENSVTLVELYQQVTKVCLELEDSSIKSSNIVNGAYAVEDDNDTKDFVIEKHELPIFKEEIDDIDEKTTIDLEKYSGNIDISSENVANDININDIIKKERSYSITLFDVEQENFQKSDSELEKLKGSLHIEDSSNKNQTGDGKCKELFLFDGISENAQKEIKFTGKCFVKPVRIEDLLRLELANAVKNDSSHAVSTSECGSTATEASASKDRSDTGDKFRTPAKQGLTPHVRTNKGKKPYVCSTCGYCTIFKRSLTVHMSTHTDTISYRCTICEFCTKTKSYLSKHLRTHTGEKPYQCTVCEYRTALKQNLTFHMRTHTGEKPYECGICEFRAGTKVRLTEHVRTHTGEKPYRCSNCEYRTALKRSLKVHMRTHSGAKPYACTICELRLRNKSSLTEHMRIHTGEKPFSCTICDFRGRRRNNLVAHMRTHQ